MQIELTTQKRASNKLVAERRDKDNDLGVMVDVKWSMSQWSTVTANQTLGCFRRRRRVASRLRKALIPLCSALVRLPRHAASSPGPPSLKGMWRNWRESWEGYHDEQESWACALQGEMEGAGMKSGEDEGTKQYSRSLRVLEEKVQRCLTQTSLIVSRWYNKRSQSQTVAGRVGLGQFREKPSSPGE